MAKRSRSQKDDPPLAQLRDFYLVACSAANLSPRTIEWYAEKISRFLRFLPCSEAVATLAELTPRAVERFVEQLRQQPKWAGHPYTPARRETVSASYIQGFVRALRAFASWLEREGYTDTNRLQHMRPPKASPPLIQPLSADEIRRVVAACASARDRALLLTLLDTGLRAGEALGLRFQDAHVEGNAATLLVLGKGDRQRLVPVGPVAQQALARYKYGPRPAPARPSVETLFLTNQGEPLTANALKMIFERLRRRSGIARLHPHICRHTFSTHYLHNGGDLFSLQMILGHRSLEMVRRYSHLADSHVLRRHREFSPLAHLSLRTPKTKEKLNGGPAAALDPDAVGYERRWR